MRWQHPSQDIESQILLVPQPVGAPLDDASLVVKPFDEAERDLVLRLVIAAIPSQFALDHRLKRRSASNAVRSGVLINSGARQTYSAAPDFSFSSSVCRCARAASTVKGLPQVFWKLD